MNKTTFIKSTLPEDNIFGQCTFSVSAAGIVAGIAGVASVAAAAVVVDAENYKRRDYKRPEIIIVAEHSIDLLMYFSVGKRFPPSSVSYYAKTGFRVTIALLFHFYCISVQNQNSEKEKNILYNKDV